MVDNRSAGFFGIGGAFNFKSGDISGTAAKLSDDKMGQGGEYFAQQQEQEHVKDGIGRHGIEGIGAKESRHQQT